MKYDFVMEQEPGHSRRIARTKPPFRADHVGSLLRPAALKEARAHASRARSTPSG